MPPPYSWTQPVERPGPLPLKLEGRVGMTTLLREKAEAGRGEVAAGRYFQSRLARQVSSSRSCGPPVSLPTRDKPVCRPQPP